MASREFTERARGERFGIHLESGNFAQPGQHVTYTDVLESSTETHKSKIQAICYRVTYCRIDRLRLGSGSPIDLQEIVSSNGCNLVIFDLKSTDPTVAKMKRKYGFDIADPARRPILVANYMLQMEPHPKEVYVPRYTFNPNPKEIETYVSPDTDLLVERLLFAVGQVLVAATNPQISQGERNQSALDFVRQMIGEPLYLPTESEE